MSPNEEAASRLAVKQARQRKARARADGRERRRQAAAKRAADLKERDRQMAAMRQQGATLQAIGDEYGLSRERVRQRLQRLGQ